MVTKHKKINTVEEQAICKDTVFEILKNISLHTADIDENGLLKESFFERTDVPEGKMRQLRTLTNKLSKL